jgi:hypothetical protein
MTRLTFVSVPMSDFWMRFLGSVCFQLDSDHMKVSAITHDTINSCLRANVWFWMRYLGFGLFQLYWDHIQFWKFTHDTINSCLRAYERFLNEVLWVAFVAFVHRSHDGFSNSHLTQLTVVSVPMCNSEWGFWGRFCINWTEMIWKFQSFFNDTINSCLRADE